MSLREWAERHDTTEDPWGWYSGYQYPFYVVSAATCWTDLGLGVSLARDYRYGNISPDWWQITLRLGPWSIALRREW